MSTSGRAPSRARDWWVQPGFTVAAVEIGAAFLAVALFLAVVAPYRDWDAFAFGEWSRAIASGHTDPLPLGAAVAHRPLYYVVQGWLWSLTGVSMAAGRLLSLAFAVTAAVAIVLLARRAMPGRMTLATATLVVVAVSPLPVFALEGMSDIPAAALVGLTALAAFSSRRSVSVTVATALLSALAALTKPSALVPLCAIAVACLLVGDGSRRARLGERAIPVLLGVCVGLGYAWAMADRFGIGLLAFLRTGLGSPWAELADERRLDAILRLDLLGGGLHLPLVFALAYGILRSIGAGHRAAGPWAFAAGLVAAVVGPIASGVSPVGSFLAVAWLVAYGVTLAAFAFAPADLAPTRADLVRLTVISIPPLVVWAHSTPYAPRLAATAWPGLAASIAVALAGGIVALRRRAAVATLLPLIALLLAAGLSVVRLDGLTGREWRALASLGVGGVWDDARVVRIFHPAIVGAGEAAREAAGPSGMVFTWSPQFRVVLGDGMRLAYPRACGDLAGSRAFILVVDPFHEKTLRAGGIETAPGHWDDCRAPRTERVTAGSGPYIVFSVRPAAGPG